MAQRKSAATRPQRKPRRFRPERSLATAAWLGAATVLAVALAVYAIKFAIPTSALHNFLELVVVNRQVSPQSPIYQDLLAQNVREDTLFTSPFSLFCGGLALALLAPPRAERARVLRAAVAVPVAILLVCLCVYWGSALTLSHGRLPPGLIDRRLVLTQTVVWLADIAAFLAGAFLGLLWRRARRRPGADGQAPEDAEGRGRSVPGAGRRV